MSTTRNTTWVRDLPPAGLGSESDSEWVRPPNVTDRRQQAGGYDDWLRWEGVIWSGRWSHWMRWLWGCFLDDDRMSSDMLTDIHIDRRRYPEFNRRHTNLYNDITLYWWWCIYLTWLMRKTWPSRCRYTWTFKFIFLKYQIFCIYFPLNEFLSMLELVESKLRLLEVFYGLFENKKIVVSQFLFLNIRLIEIQMRV